MVLDVFLVIATAKRPMEEYRFAREMLGIGWHWNILEVAGIATGVSFASLVGVTILQLISFVKYQDFDPWVIQEGLLYQVPILMALGFTLV